MPLRHVGKGRHSYTILEFGMMEVSVSFTHRPIYPRGNSSCTHWEGGEVGPRTDLDAVEKRKILFLSKIEPWPPNPLPVTIPTELSLVSKTSIIIGLHGVPSSKYRIPISFAIPEILLGRFYGQKYFMEK
jgi:hypothetical protein